MEGRFRTTPNGLECFAVTHIWPLRGGLATPISVKWGWVQPLTFVYMGMVQPSPPSPNNFIYLFIYLFLVLVL